MHSHNSVDAWLDHIEKIYLHTIASRTKKLASGE
jgi:hypothetical protein